MFILKHSNFMLSILILFCLSANAFAVDDIIDEEYFLIEIEDCEGVGDLCLDIPLGESQFYDLMVNGEAYQGMVSGCNFDTTYAYSYANLSGAGNLGPYMLDSWVVNGMTFTAEFQDMVELLDLMNFWDPTGNWVLNPVSQLIVGGDPSNAYSVMNVTTILINSPNIIGFNLGLEPRGTVYSFPKGVHTVVITNSLTGCMDEFEVEVVCIEQGFVEYELEVGDVGTHCFDFSDLPGNLQSINNITPPDAEPVASYAFVNGNTCLEYTGIAEGTDTVCIVFCDDLNFCDTTKVALTVTIPLIQREEVVIDIQVYDDVSYCFDLLEQLPGTINSINRICEGEGEDVQFGILNHTDNCIDLKGLDIGTDRICYRFMDDLNNILEIILIVNVLAPVPEIVEIEMILGQNYEACLDLSEISGRAEEISNLCPQNSGNSVLFTINDLSLCLEIESLAAGLETICIEFCDENGICDNVEYRISVIDDGTTSPPSAVDDQINISYNESITIDICENDNWNADDLTEFNILSIQEGGNGPYNGSVSFNTNCEITYQPNEGYCGEDFFTYIICNENGCDGASVSINIECAPEDPEEFFVYSGMSPNEDGFNDTFKITGLKNYPGSVLNVYNRWGHVVYHKVDYDNDWNGIWNNRILPDGTYFYDIELKPGMHERGYLQINR